MYSTILFDFDGTLTSSLDAWLIGFQKAFSAFGQSISDEIIIERCFHRAFEEIVREFGLPCAIQFSEMLYAGLAEAYQQVELFNGVKEILQECRDGGIKLAVVTSAPGEQVEAVMRNLEIESFFSSVVSKDQITNFKPHPEPVLLALKNLGSDAHNTLFVGDSTADMLAGRAAGTKTALFFPDIHKPFYDYQQLLDTKPDFVFKHYQELSSHVIGSPPINR
jgi:HAD superfamily hydrolase (TIGR01549 family)